MVKIVQDDGAGGISTFIGTTRNTFHGKRVLRLEYECYEPMALKELHKLAAAVRERWPLVKLALLHRVGVVEIGQASVVISASSVHRREAIEVRFRQHKFLANPYMIDY